MPRPARIGIFVYGDCAGGIEHFIERLMTALLATHGQKFELYALVSTDGPTARFLRARGHRVTVLHHADLNDERETLDWLRRNKLDLVMTASYLGVVAVACARLKIPHIWRCGGLYTVVDPSAKPGHAERLFSLMCLLSVRIVANSQTIASQFETVRNHVVVIENGIENATRAVGEFPRLRERHGWPRRARLIAMIGHLVPSKRHEDFMHAAALVAARHRDCRFVIFGDIFAGAPGRKLRPYLAHLEDLRRTLGLEEILAFERELDDLTGVFPQIDMVVHPCALEGLPNAVMEAMAWKKPIVAANGGGCAELLRHRRSGLLVRPKAPDAFARAIGYLLRNPARARALAAAAQVAVRERYDIRATAGRYAELFTSALQSNGQA